MFVAYLQHELNSTQKFMKQQLRLKKEYVLSVYS